MPSDTELTLELTAPVRLEVMTRVLRLPTSSLRQARAIVRMQLDRLSPLPARDVVVDLVRLKAVGGETDYALGILRRHTLQDPAFASRRFVTAARPVDGVDVLFRFRNTFARDDREARLLASAPKAALIALGLAAVALSGQIRADQWSAQRLPEIAEAQRIAARTARDDREQQAAIKEWTALDRTDAATRFLCVSGKIGTRLAVATAGADAKQVMITPLDAAEASRLEALGGTLSPAGGGAAAPVIFAEDVCG